MHLTFVRVDFHVSDITHDIKLSKLYLKQHNSQAKPVLRGFENIQITKMGACLATSALKPGWT